MHGIKNEVGHGMEARAVDQQTSLHLRLSKLRQIRITCQQNHWRFKVRVLTREQTPDTGPELTQRMRVSQQMRWKERTDMAADTYPPMLHKIYDPI